MILVNEVIKISIAGAMERIVIRKIICNVTATSFGAVAPSTPNLKAGRGIGSAAYETGTKSKIVRKITINFSFLMIPPYP